MELSYRQLEAILAAFLNVHPDRMGTFRSRMKQLQRLEFPVGVNIGRGVRMTYTPEHVLQLAAAFEIIGTGLAAKAATDLVTEYWSRFAIAFGRAAKRLSMRSQPETYVCIAGKPPVTGEAISHDHVTVHDLASLTEQVLTYPSADRPSRAGMIIIRVDYMLERVNRLAGDIGQVKDAKRAAIYRDWSQAWEESSYLWDRTNTAAPF